MSVVYSTSSQNNFDELDVRLQRILTYVKDVLQIDHSVIEGFRPEEEQMAAYNSETSQLKWPESKHNRSPSLAVDVIPYIRIPSRKGGVHWHDGDPKIKELYTREMVRLATVIQMVGLIIFNTPVRWGGDWDRDWSVMDNTFNDYPHVELI